MTKHESYIDIDTLKSEPCDWGAWNQFLIFLLLEETEYFDKVRVIGPHATVARFLKAEGYKPHLHAIKALPR